MADGYARKLEPNISSFYAPGISGEFFSNQNQEICFMPKQMLRYNNSNTGYYTITKDDGTIYYFGKSAAYYGHTSNGGSADITSKSYYLMKIVTPELYEIKYEYEDYPVAIF